VIEQLLSKSRQALSTAARDLGNGDMDAAANRCTIPRSPAPKLLRGNRSVPPALFDPSPQPSPVAGEGIFEEGD
jgi:hypothetical protein